MTAMTELELLEKIQNALDSDYTFPKFVPYINKVEKDLWLTFPASDQQFVISVVPTRPPISSEPI